MEPITLRRRIIALLSDQEMDVRELSQELGIKEKEVYEHLVHVERSVAAASATFILTPSQCLLCGYLCCRVLRTGLRSTKLHGIPNDTGLQTGVPAGPVPYGRNSVASCGDHPYVYRMLPCGFRTLKLLSNPCGPSPCDGLSPSPTTMTAPTPSRHLNRSLSSPLQGGRLGLPRSLSDTLRRSVGSSCTPVRYRLITPSVAAG